MLFSPAMIWFHCYGIYCASTATEQSWSAKGLCWQLTIQSPKAYSSELSSSQSYKLWALQQRFILSFSSSDALSQGSAFSSFLYLIRRVEDCLNGFTQVGFGMYGRIIYWWIMISPSLRRNGCLHRIVGLIGYPNRTASGCKNSVNIDLFVACLKLQVR